MPDRGCIYLHVLIILSIHFIGHMCVDLNLKMGPSLSLLVAYTSLWMICQSCLLLLDCGFLCEELRSDIPQEAFLHYWLCGVRTEGAGGHWPGSPRMLLLPACSWSPGRGAGDSLSDSWMPYSAMNSPAIWSLVPFAVRGMSLGVFSNFVSLMEGSWRHRVGWIVFQSHAN